MSAGEAQPGKTRINVDAAEWRLSDAPARVDDYDHVADGTQLGPGEEHPAHAASLGFRPGDLARIIVVETAGKHLLPVCPI
jgi:hypothetical protein